MSAATVVILALVLLALGLAGCWCSACIRAEFHRARADNLERWLRGNLRAIELDSGHLSPQVVSVIHSLECALPILGPIDLRALRRDISRLGRERDAHVTQAANEWAARTAAIAAADAKGAPLPGFEQGGAQ